MSTLVETILRQKHGVIEASAGTGKTHTILELVLRLVMSGVPLEKILVLTYTEKATSELRQRIRARILENWRKAAPGTSERERLRQAADQFDGAAIYTIHGFCQRVLTRHAFENRQPFALEVVDDSPLYLRFLREEQRRRWPQLLGQGVGQETLADFLALSGYECGEEATSWESGVIAVARTWRPESDTLRPAPPGDIATLVENESRKIAPVRRALLAFLQLPENAGLSVEVFDEKIRQVHCLKVDVQDALRKHVVEPLCAGNPPSDRERLVALVKSLKPDKKAFIQHWHAQGFASLKEDPWTKGGNKSQRAAVPEQNKRLERLVSALCELDSLKQFFGCLCADTARKLRLAVDAYKEAHGLLSFEDMLTRLDRALDPHGENTAAPLLLKALREQYLVALVDEFQDTDPVQWRILKRIFIAEEGEKLPQRLYVIGDPKQAIYGFRGADVTVYQEAAQFLRDGPLTLPSPRGGEGNEALPLPPSARGGGKEGPRLTVSYRSTSELLGALNGLFAAQPQDAGPWFGRNSGIPYAPIEAPRENKKIELQYPALGHAAVNLVDLKSAETAAAARKDMARAVAREITQLLDWRGSPGASRLRFVVEKNGEKKERGLEADDIAILVDVRRTAAIFEKALDELPLPIPHTFYKKGGLYQSEEARHLSILLQALADPADHAAFRKALLTHFFRVPAEELEACAELPPEHPIKQQFERWGYYAQHRNWPRLFQSLLEDTGVLWCWEARSAGVSPAVCGAGVSPALAGGTPAVRSAPDMERRGTNYQHILEELEDAARRSHLDFDGVCALLEARRQELLPAPEDRDLQRLETEDPKVRIMTVHASKGLQYPVVFVCAGFTESRRDGFFRKYHERKDGIRQTNLVYNFGTDTGKELQEEENDEERRRLYYVALTRAQCLLYVPYLPQEKETDGKRKKLKCAGPACTLLYPAMAAAWGGKHDGRAVAMLVGQASGLPTMAGGTPALPSAGGTPALPSAGGTPAVQSAPDGWLDPLEPDRLYITATATLQSFSALKESRPRPLLVLGDEKPRDWDEGADEAPAPSADVDSAPDALPRGRLAGLALHEVLEQVDFRAVQEASWWEQLLGGEDYRKLLGAALDRHGLRTAQPPSQLTDDPCAQALTRLVWAALRAELPDFPSGKLRLCDLEKSDRLHELAFNLPLPSPEDISCKPPAFKGSCGHATGYLNGVIDLVFRAGRGPDCRYYVLDWKSNWVPGGYNPATLAGYMREEKYDLQQSIYTLAVLRWLAQCGIDAAQFGGAYYVFLRGVDAARPGDGFFRDFKPPRQEDFEFSIFDFR
ncbi:MAG: UvrD-helicase domain-containing protein [Planctomycetota bacterium]